MPDVVQACVDRMSVRIDGHGSQTASAFYLTALDGSDATICASLDEKLSDVLGRIYPEGLPADPFTIMVGVLPDARK